MAGLPVLMFVKATTALGVNLTSSCPDGFSELAKTLTPLQNRTAVLSKHAAEIYAEADRLHHAVQKDVTKSFASSSSDSFMAKVSNESIVNSNRIVQKIAADLRAQGYEVQIKTVLPSTFHELPVPVALPEHDVLILRSGQAKGPLARELRRYEKDTATRLGDLNLPLAVRNAGAPVTVDPLKTAMFPAGAVFDPTAQEGAAVLMSVESLTQPMSYATEYLRHELRHTKTYYDLLSGKQPIGRASVTDFSSHKVVDNSNYSNFFSTDELDAITSSLRSAQTTLRKEIEAVRRVRASGRAVSREEETVMLRNLQALRQYGLSRAQTLNEMTEKTLEYAARTRSRLLDPGLSPVALRARLVSTGFDNRPGYTQIAVLLDEKPSRSGAMLQVWMPQQVAEKGDEAIRSYVLQYCNDIEKHALEVRKKTKERISDISRNPLDRLHESP